MKKLIKVKHFDECPHCGWRLTIGLGVVSKCTQIMTENGFDSLDIEETLGYYCPDCGGDISRELGERIQNELEGRILNV